MSRTYKTKRLGKEINLDAILAKNAKMVAVGNANMNAQGDIIGKNGKIIEKAADRARSDYAVSEKAIKHVSIKKEIHDEIENAEAEEKARKRKMVDKEANLRKQLANSKKKNKPLTAETPKNEDSLRPTPDPNVFEKIDESGDIMLVDKNGKPVTTEEMLKNPDGEIE